MTTQNPDDVVGPERIFITDNEIDAGLRENIISTFRIIAEDIEYVRADLFDKLKEERDDLAVKFGDIGRACKNAMDERDLYRNALEKIQNRPRKARLPGALRDFEISASEAIHFINGVVDKALNPQEHGGGE